MLNEIKSWANSLLCIGIFTAIVEMMLPKGNVKKYIYVIIGIVTLLTIISPIISKENYEKIATDAVIETISEKVYENQNRVLSKVDKDEYLQYQKDMVKNEYINNLKKSIWNDLTKEGVVLDSILIDVTDDYEVSSVVINVKKYSDKQYKSKKDILNYINNYYLILDENIKINEGE